MIYLGLAVCELGYPNREVEGAMSKHLAIGYSCLPDDDFGDIFKIGCAFDWDKRNLGKWLVL